MKTMQKYEPKYADYDYDGWTYPANLRPARQAFQQALQLATDNEHHEEIPFPTDFRTLENSLAKQFTVQGNKLGALFQQYHACTEKMAGMGREFNHLLTVMSAANGVSLPLMQYQPQPKAFGVELAQQSIEAVGKAMTAELRTGLHRFLAEVLATLDHSVGNKTLGLIKWHTPTICRYSTLALTKQDRQLDMQTERWQTQRASPAGTTYTAHAKTTRLIERTYRFGLFTEDLIDAGVSPLFTPSIDPPPRVAEVIRAIPTWFRDPARIVTGTQIAERSAVVDLGSEKVEVTEIDSGSAFQARPREPVLLPMLERFFDRIDQMIPAVPRFRFDPAVIVGHYVLAGWTDEEGEKSMQKRKHGELTQELREQLAEARVRLGRAEAMPSRCGACGSNWRRQRSCDTHARVVQERNDAIGSAQAEIARIQAKARQNGVRL